VKRTGERDAWPDQDVNREEKAAHVPAGAKAMESEVARLDRAKQVLESQS
jgi:hypothetical protein